MRHLKEMRNFQVIFHLDEMHDILPSSTRPQGMHDRQLTARTHTVKCFIRKQYQPHHIDGCQKSNTAAATTTSITKNMFSDCAERIQQF
jgi:hypothetical protein